MPNVYTIGGANGSGKTTVALNLLPNILEVFELRLNVKSLSSRPIKTGFLTHFSDD
jgi:predicted ABC-type ATPase